ncbi:D-glycero-beta-D-manno-heptose 1-phosphate adenylyltransferase [Microbacterium sp. USHLN186]|uniref:D-glycero-beta-D-manno-heptose 1-phosphate adenylyltransferase n=1 Tax=Microbacterium sp. USHLN186 TaxID=3081286 RepID=UPI0030183D69
MRITVVGDTLLDEDLTGSSSRLCPDAPVPVVEVLSRSRRAGGAGLVANMLAGDGHDVELVTALSDDAVADSLRACLDGIRLVAGPSGAPTPVKTRLRCNGEPFGRLDEGCDPAPAPHATAQMLAAVDAAELLVVADYGRGLMSDPALRDALERRAARVPLVWDPHPRGAPPVPAAWLVTPNAAEASAAADLPEQAEPSAVAAALRERWGCRAVVVTLGAAGAMLQEGAGSPLHIEVDDVTDADPCGAGDRFAATAAVVLGSTGDAALAVREAASAAGAYLAAGGVSALVAPPPSTRAARSASGGERSNAPASASGDARAVIAAVRARGGTVVATGGCFDLLHAGHVRTLQAARDLGDCLIVCLNSDASVRRLKGSARPLIGERDRVELLGALSCVDAVVIFEEDSPEEVIARLRPDIWVKGGDYSAAALPETRLLESWGGRTLTLPFHLGRSTTALAAKLAAVI